MKNDWVVGLKLNHKLNNLKYLGRFLAMKTGKLICKYS